MFYIVILNKFNCFNPKKKSNICRVCGSEKRYDDYHRLDKPCDSSNTKRAVKHFYKNKDKILDKKDITIIIIKTILTIIIKNEKVNYQILKIKLIH